MPNTPCISIVDDDESVRDALKSLLESTGLNTRLFASAEEFLQSCNVQVTDCLIVDVRMGGMSGLELQAELIARKNQVPVIFITAHDDEYVRTRAMNAGAVGVLLKPFSEDALLNSIHFALQNRTY